MDLDNFFEVIFESFKEMTSSKKSNETELTTLTCDECSYIGLEITSTYINKVGQLISIVKCPKCGHIEAICECGAGKEIERVTE